MGGEILTKKFVIKEAWLLDENRDRKIKLTTLEKDEITNKVEEENIRGGCGRTEESK
jgi:hypothetical protein